jgi:subtilisin family serine protease
LRQIESSLQSINTLLWFLLLIFFPLLAFVGCKKSEEVSKEAKVTIDPPTLNISKDIRIAHLISAKIENALAESIEVEWSSNNTRVATITAQGHVTGRTAGEAYITATLVGTKAFATCKVTVYDENDYKFRLVLKDKGVSSFAISRPGEFLSEKAIDRRTRQNIVINETDLPVSIEYLREIRKSGGIIVAQSKWLNTVTVHCTSEYMADEYKKLPFVKEVILVWEGKKAGTKTSKTGSITNHTIKNTTDYGSAWDNINLHKGNVLHDNEFKGDGITIAVIDAGFNNLNANFSLNNIKIKGSKSFIYSKPDPYSLDNHGLWVTSCMAANKPGLYVGTAPGANYWLLTAEDVSMDFAIEEDYWVSAIEYADSLGVDIVNTSLYHKTHKGFSDYYKHEDMDGKTAVMTRAANLAAEKGIFIAACAGNDQSWVGAPGDSPHVLTVGSVVKSGAIGSFTSFGITADGRIKPDIVSLGGNAAVIGVTGSIEYRSGTSYASPIICGLVACLWQAYPKLTNKDLLDIIKKSANRYQNPVLPYGYGIPDMETAMQLAKAVSDSK